MLTDGLNHVAILTHDIPRLREFYTRVFEAETAHQGDEPGGPPGTQMLVLYIGPHTELNIFQIEGNDEADRQTPMFGRGRLDHMALHAASLEAFDTARDRLMAAGATDDFVTDFGPILSLFFRDPDGLECELCIINPDAVPGVFNGPGTRAARYPAASGAGSL